MNDETRETAGSEEPLRRERELLGAILDNSTDVIFAFDHACCITVWNATAERLTNVSKAEALGRPAADIPLFYELTGGDACYRRVLDGEKVRLAEQSFFIRTFGIEAILDVFLTPLRGAAGEVEAGLGIVHDITRHKRAEEALAASEERYRRQAEELELIYRRVPIGLCVFDPQLHFRRINDRLAEINGLPVEAHIGRTAREIVPALADLAETLAERIRTTGEPVLNVEVEGETPSQPGVRRYWNEHWLPLKDDEEHVRGIHVVVEEITERKRSEKALRDANEALTRTLAELKATQQQVIQSEKLAALGSLAAGLVHELNNPLMGIMGYVAFVRRHEKDPELLPPLDSADEALLRIRGLLKNLLNFSRPSFDELTAVDLGVAISRTTELLAPEFRASQITFHQDVPETLPPVLAKAGQLQQVFLNLLLNARDAVSTQAEKRVNLRAYTDDDQVAVEIRDTGEGVPEEIRNRIFDPFFTTKPPGQGTGLGLSIVQSIVSGLGGSIEVGGVPGEGARFTVRLPFASSPNQPPEAQKEN